MSDEAKIISTLYDTPSFKHKRFLYVHDNTSEPSGILGNAFYYIKRNNERALLAMRDVDYCVLNSEPDEGFVKYLSELGLLKSKSIIVMKGGENSPDSICRGERGTEILETLGNSFVYYPFYSSKNDVRAGKILGMQYFGSPDPKVALEYFDKISFREVAEGLRIQVAPGSTVHFGGRFDNEVRDDLEDVINEFAQANGKVLVLPPCSAGGVGIYVVDTTLECGNGTCMTTNEAVDAVLKRHHADELEKVLIVTKMNVVESPTVFGYISEKGEIFFLSKTVQLIEKYVKWGGTLIDLFDRTIDGQLYEQSLKLCKHMAANGYKGAFGFDFIETDDGSVIPVECNARVTGSHIPFECAMRLKEKHKVEFKTLLMPKMFSKMLKFESFGDFRKSKLGKFLWKPGKKEGMVPLRYYKMIHGEFEMMIFAMSQRRAKELKSQFLEVIKGLEQDIGEQRELTQ